MFTYVHKIEFDYDLHIIIKQRITMRLRSGNRYADDNENVTVRRSKMFRKYAIFRLTCEDFIVKLNDSECAIHRLGVLYALYTYIDDNADHIYDFILHRPRLTQFITSIADRAVILIKDLMYHCSEEPDLSISKTNGIEESRMVYELKNKLHDIVREAKAQMNDNS